MLNLLKETQETYKIETTETIKKINLIKNEIRELKKNENKDEDEDEDEDENSINESLILSSDCIYIIFWIILINFY